jgi:hypothetical protein
MLDVIKRKALDFAVKHSGTSHITFMLLHLSCCR